MPITAFCYIGSTLSLGDAVQRHHKQRGENCADHNAVARSNEQLGSITVRHDRTTLASASKRRLRAARQAKTFSLCFFWNASTVLRTGGSSISRRTLFPARFQLWPGWKGRVRRFGRSNSSSPVGESAGPFHSAWPSSRWEGSRFVCRQWQPIAYALAARSAVRFRFLGMSRRRPKPPRGSC
jgi:hypothetical protein